MFSYSNSKAENWNICVRAQLIVQGLMPRILENQVLYGVYKIASKSYGIRTRICRKLICKCLRGIHSLIKES